MRNNLNEHFESLRQQSASNEVATQQAPQLNFVVPTEFVDLPSQGKYYREGHPLKDKTSVEIRQMTAKEEDILTNKSFIKKGVVIDKLIESLLVDKTIDVSTLLIGDKNAIMVAARMAAYGATYDLLITCGECGSKKMHEVDLNGAVQSTAEKVLETLKEDKKAKFSVGDFNSVLIQLPKTGWIAECRMLNGVDEKKMLTLIETKKARNMGDELSLSEQLAIIIQSINTVEDAQALADAIKVMPASDAKYLRTTYQKLVPNVKIMTSFSCENCFSRQEMEVPFTQEFFWPK